MSDKVVVLGGGVAGLTAAQELAERDFEVEVYEKRDLFGGKARSMGVPDSSTGGREPLPGEHGFRFFPSFYRHMFDTMKRIPYGNNDQGVYENLRSASHWMTAREGASEVTLPVNLPTSIEDWKEVYDVIVDNEFGIPLDETRHFADRILTFLTSCQERREEEYDEISWWDFIDADEMSEAYRKYLAVGLTRDLVAMRAEDSSTRTVAKIYIQLLLGVAAPWLDVDSLLDGPTSDVWIDPWVSYLKQLGVTFHREAKVESFECNDDGEITSVDITQQNGTETVTADYYVSALPVEVMTEVIDDNIKEHAPTLRSIDRLQTAWMNGIQYYFDSNLELNQGHTLYVDSPWALTSIVQDQFWDDEFPLSEYGDGEVEAILSICISNWEEDGEEIQKPAKDCTEEEVKQEVWAQLTNRLNDGPGKRLDKSEVIDSFLDPDIEFNGDDPTTNAEPLLINTVGSLDDRPEASTQIPNLFLASDYVRTHTDLATMESANEAARRATNGIIAEADADAEPAEVWPLKEPSIFDPLKAYDRMRFEMGLPHQGMT